MIESEVPTVAAPRILVVDDEPDMLELLLVAMTSLRKYDVVPVASASDALDNIAATRDAFDVFVLDIQMPAMGGLELLDEIRKMPCYADTPVIMLTAMSERHYVEDAFRRGANGFVTKPFDYDDLLDRIDAVYAASARGEGPSGGASPQPTQSGRVISKREATGKDAPCIGRNDFHAAIRRMAPLALSTAAITAVRLVRCGAADRPPSPAALVALGGALSRATRSRRLTFCHWGEGTFVVLSDATRRNLVTKSALECSLQTAPLGGEMPEGYDIMVGPPIPLSACPDDPRATILQAIEEADLTHPPAEQTVQPPPGAIGGNLYERVLEELFGERTYLGKA